MTPCQSSLYKHADRANHRLKILKSLLIDDMYEKDGLTNSTWRGPFFYLQIFYLIIYLSARRVDALVSSILFINFDAIYKSHC